MEGREGEGRTRRRRRGEGKGKGAGEGGKRGEVGWNGAMVVGGKTPLLTAGCCH